MQQGENSKQKKILSSWRTNREDKQQFIWILDHNTIKKCNEEKQSQA